MSSKSERKDMRISVRIPAKMAEQIEDIALDNNISKAEVIRLLFQSALYDNLYEKRVDLQDVKDTLDDFRFTLTQVVSNFHKIGYNINQIARALNGVALALRVITDNQQKFYDSYGDIYKLIAWKDVQKKLQQLLGDNPSAVLSKLVQEMSNFDVLNSDSLKHDINELTKGINALCQLLK